MKFLELQFNHAKVIKETNKSILFGSNSFFHPITKHHVYNVMCVLLDRTPKPQLRDTNNKYMPFYEDVMGVVNDGYIKTTIISEEENITTVKKAWNANAMNAPQYTWVDCRYVIGTLFNTFIYRLSKILNKSETIIINSPFDNIIEELQSRGVKDETGIIKYSDDGIKDLISWCKLNQSTPLANYIQDTQKSSRPTQFGKRVFRGNTKSSKYSGVIYIPLTETLLDELILHTKGHATILDGGLVKIMGYHTLMEDDVDGFTKISQLNGSRKYNTTFDKTKSVDGTIYNNIDSNNITLSINKIINDVGVSINDNKDAYDSMMDKILKLEPTDSKAIANKLNFFIEKSINNQYK
jgi:hypothetical protein